LIIGKSNYQYIDEYHYRIAFDVAFDIYLITEYVDGLADTKVEVAHYNTCLFVPQKRTVMYHQSSHDLKERVKLQL